jgi:anti-anti-sigma factor
MGIHRFPVQKRNSSSHISFIGEINVDSADNFKKHLQKAASNNSEDLRIDFSRLTYIDSQGLNVLAFLYNELRKQNRRIIISNPNKNVYLLLRITGFDRIMRIEKS